MKTMLGCRVHQLGIFYDRRFDVTHGSEAALDLPNAAVDAPKLGYPSSDTLALELARPGGRVLLWGAANLADALAEKRVCAVTMDGEDVPADTSQFDQIFLLDVIEHLREPERFVEELRAATTHARPEIVLTTPNVAFVVTRLMLLLGRFNYSRRGILDLTHTRLFTFKSLRALMHQAGYKILEIGGIPAPFPKALGDHWFSRALLHFNTALIRIAPRLFAYQIYLKVKAQPTVKNLLAETLDSSAELRRKIEEETAKPV